ncbi:hypothetical protein T06_6140 [Trichinella sp. T6]|nr:hypothetical protein T06_6140 [Trichinella sp. T6]
MVVAGYVTGLTIFNLMAALLCYDFCCGVSSTSRLCTLVNRWQIVRNASDGNRKMQSTMTEDQVARKLRSQHLIFPAGVVRDVVVVIEGVNVEAKSKKSAANKEKLNLLLEELDQLCGESEEVTEQVSVTEELYCEADVLPAELEQKKARPSSDKSRAGGRSGFQEDQDGRGLKEYSIFDRVCRAKADGKVSCLFGETLESIALCWPVCRECPLLRGSSKSERTLCQTDHCD